MSEDTINESVPKLVNPLYKAITGREGLRSDNVSVPSMITEVAKYLGTTPPHGISDRTWRRLRADPTRQVVPATRRALQAAQRRARLSPAKEAKLRADRPGIKMKASLLMSATAEKRVLNIGSWPDGDDTPHIGGMMNPVLDAWLSGDDKGAARAFLEPIEAHLHLDVLLTDVKWIKFGGGSKK